MLHSYMASLLTHISTKPSLLHPKRRWMNKQKLSWLYLSSLSPSSLLSWQLILFIHSRPICREKIKHNLSTKINLADNSKLIKRMIQIISKSNILFKQERTRIWCLSKLFTWANTILWVVVNKWDILKP